MLTNKIELKDLLSENKITEPCLSIEFEDKVSTYERETLVNDIIENNLRLRRRMY